MVTRGEGSSPSSNIDSELVCSISDKEGCTLDCCGDELMLFVTIAWGGLEGEREREEGLQLE